jgi:hypothetical protein
MLHPSHCLHFPGVLFQCRNVQVCIRKADPNRIRKLFTDVPPDGPWQRNWKVEVLNKLDARLGGFGVKENKYFPLRPVQQKNP